MVDGDVHILAFIVGCHDCYLVHHVDRETQMRSGVMCVDRETRVADEIEELTILSVDFIAERDTAGSKVIGAGINWDGEHWVSTDDV